MITMNNTNGKVYNDQRMNKYFVVLPDFWAMGSSVCVKNSICGHLINEEVEKK